MCSLLKFVVICILMRCAYSAYNARTGADDTFRRKTPIEFLRATANFLSSKGNERLTQRLRDLQSEIFQTNYQQVLKDILESGVLDNIDDENTVNRIDEYPFRSQEFAVAVEANNTTPAYHLTTAENDNVTSSMATMSENVTTVSTTPSANATTPSANATTPSANATTPSANATTPSANATTPSANATTPGPTAPTPQVNPVCSNDTNRMMTAITERQPWALQMLDAAGKPSPNLEGYQLFWVGDFEQCSKVRAVDNSTGIDRLLFKGRYCTAVVPFTPMDIRPLMPALPPSGLRIGLCVPDSCSGQDVTMLLNGMLAVLNTSYQVGLTTCQQPEIDYDAKAIIALFICSVFLLLMTVGTLYDLLVVQRPAWSAQAEEAEGNGPATGENGYTTFNNAVVDRPEQVNNLGDGERQPLLGETRQKVLDPEGPRIGTKGHILLAFSVYTNGKKILTASHTPGSITCIHGIRFLSMTWVILGHTFIFGLTTAENFLTFLEETKGLWTFQAIIGAPVSVDTFFCISGLLVAYLILKEMDRRKGKVQWFLFYFHRFWRLTPPYALVMMMQVTLFRYFTNGPNWPQEGTEINYCRDSWWTNLLYVNNFVKVKEMCLNWSWYLANDMQFFVISPLLFVPLFFWRRIGVVLALLWLVATMTTAGVIARVNNFPPSVSAGDATDTVVSIDYFSDFYIKPYCRFGPYVVGMLTGYALFVTKCKVKMNLLISLSGWAVATATGLAVVYGLYGPSNDHPLTSDVSALYNALNHTVWGACVCWVIFACATGHGGPVNTLLSWNAFIPLSRLTYMAYLVHPIIINLYHLGAPAAFYLTTFHASILFLGFTVAAFGAAMLLSLAFEAPMMALEKVLLPKPRKH